MADRPHPFLTDLIANLAQAMGAVTISSRVAAQNSKEAKESAQQAARAKGGSGGSNLGGLGGRFDVLSGRVKGDNNAKNITRMLREGAVGQFDDGGNLADSGEDYQLADDTGAKKPHTLGDVTRSYKNKQASKRYAEAVRLGQSRPDSNFVSMEADSKREQSQAEADRAARMEAFRQEAEERFRETGRYDGKRIGLRAKIGGMIGDAGKSIGGEFGGGLSQVGKFISGASAEATAVGGAAASGGAAAGAAGAAGTAGTVAGIAALANPVTATIAAVVGLTAGTISVTKALHRMSNEAIENSRDLAKYNGTIQSAIAIYDRQNRILQIKTAQEQGGMIKKLAQSTSETNRRLQPYESASGKAFTAALIGFQKSLNAAIVVAEFMYPGIKTAVDAINNLDKNNQQKGTLQTVLHNLTGTAGLTDHKRNSIRVPKPLGDDHRMPLRK